MQKVFIGLVIILLTGYLGVSWYFSSLLIASETATLVESQQRYQQEAMPWNEPVSAEIVTIESNDVTIEGNYYANPADSNCAVLMLHGYQNTRYETLLRYAPLFWDSGCDLLAYDARGHGNSSAVYHTYGYHERDDALAAYQWLQTKTGLQQDQIGVFGVSYGAATALQMLPLQPNVAFVIADSSYQDLQTIVRERGNAQFGAWTTAFIPTGLLFAELRANFEVDAVSPQDAIAMSESPIFLIHAIDDETTLSSHSEAIFAHSDQSQTELHITDWGASHAASIIADYDAYVILVDDFLAMHVPTFPAASR